MKVAIYARVSTSDKDQDPETQLIHLRDYCMLRDGKYIGSMSTRPWRRTLPTAPLGENYRMLLPNTGSRRSWCSSSTGLSGPLNTCMIRFTLGRCWGLPSRASGSSLTIALPSAG